MGLHKKRPCVNNRIIRGGFFQMVLGVIGPGSISIIVALILVVLLIGKWLKK
jgi:hypothetical protein